MKRGLEVSATFPDLYLVHQNLPGQEVAEHEHADEHQLILVLQGEVRVGLGGGVTLKAGAGKGVYLPPACPHAFASPNEAQGERLIAHVKDRLWKKVGGTSLRAGVFPSPALCQELLFFLLLHKGTRYAEGLAGAVVIALCETLADGAEAGRGDGGRERVDPGEAGAWLEHLVSRIGDPRVKKAARFVCEGATQDITLASIAKASGLSERNLSRLFVAETGFTPKQLQTRVRVALAKELLSSPRASVTEVAFATGYSSISLFVRAFRNVTGMVPSLWRETGGVWRETGSG